MRVTGPLLSLVEIVLTQFRAYFEYLKDYWGVSESGELLTGPMKMIRFIVDFTVLVMQIFIVLLLQYTRLSIIIIDNYAEQVLNLYLCSVLIGYMLLKAGVWAFEVGSFLCSRTSKEISTEIETRRQRIDSKTCKIVGVLQLAFYYLGVWFLWIVVILIVARSTKKSENDELKLVFNEQIMYKRAALGEKFDHYLTGRIDATGQPEAFQYSPAQPTLSKCAGDFKFETIKGDLGFPDKMSCSVSDNEVTVAMDVYKITNPIVMKVWAWTRFLVLQNQIIDKKCAGKCEPASELYCKNGFEQHWGQCKLKQA